ncbi:MAG: response regulator transcription factor [Planctomycetota bacterium]|jgi:DNA-binding response OmpR family regulator|nr:DNA-binding response regulator [Planctomycetota bacterium]MDP6370087.1 response regulator transcription factor [Planctomycetota bacterium]MDP6838487.1 response regulator transcription factor [Planctomycetota bacterium]MDP6956489.1 response regulator transcription factor [Planctomycetota bacterium]
MTRILLVEDEELVGTMVRMNLESEGHEVVWLRDAEAAWQTLASSAGRFDLVLLDIALPGMSGLDLLEKLRAAELGTPVLMLTARSDVSTKVAALDHGADDYLTKPFDVPELVARVKAMIRRSQAEREIPTDQLVHIGEYEIDLRARRAASREGAVTLSDKEVRLLQLFLSSEGETLKRADILDIVWGMDAWPSERTVDNFILRLRKLFELDHTQPRHFLTVRGLGYRFVH